MNATRLARIAAMAVRNVPWATVTLRDKDGNATTGKAVGVPEGAIGDTLAAQGTTRTKAERFTLLPEGLAFAPAPTMTIERGTQRWTILGVATLNPSGADVIRYGITATR